MLPINPIQIPNWIVGGEYYHLIQRAADLLDSKPENIRTIDSQAVGRYYVEHLHKIEKLIKREGLIYPHTHLYLGGARTSINPEIGNGLLLYETSTSKPIRFVQIIDYGRNGEFVNSFFIKQSDTFCFIRRARKAITNRPLPKIILDDAVWQEIIDNTVNFVKTSRKYRSYGIRPSRGLIIHGKPGCGKTMICRWLEEYCINNRINYRQVSSTDILKSHEDGSLELLVNSHRVIFFDDIDISYFTRKANGGIACSFLNALDGISEQSCCVRIFTTNESLDEMDDAFKRPGRIDRSIKLGLPTPELRKKLIESWPNEFSGLILQQDAVSKTEGFTFAELEFLRTTLVINTLTHNDPWNLNRALNDVKHRLCDIQNKDAVGFGG